MRKAILMAALGAALAGPALAQGVQGGGGTAGPTPMDGRGGTGTMPNQVMPGGSAAQGVTPGVTPTDRGPPAPGQPVPGGGAGQLSSRGQIQPGSPALGGGTGGGAGSGGGQGGGGAGSGAGGGSGR